MVPNQNAYNSFESRALMEKRNYYYGILYPARKRGDTIKAVLYVFGLVFALGAVANLIMNGLDIVNSTMILLGGIAVYFWHKEDQHRKLLQSEIELIEQELSHRGESHY